MDDLVSSIGIKQGHVVAVIGAGGKHTLMHHLGRQLIGAGQPVLLTSTTNLHRNVDYTRLSLLLADGNLNWQKHLQSSLTDKAPFVVAQSQLSTNMYRGFDPETIDRLTAAVPNAVILVKADGARKRLFKAPAPYEPVFPPRVDICVLVMSLAAIGKPISEKYVHRIDRVKALTSGDTVTPQAIIDVIAKPQGYAERLPQQGRSLLYLSSCNSPQPLAFAREIFDKTANLFDAQIAGDTITGTFHGP